MSKTWLVTVHHFKRNVLKKSFIFVLLSVPLFLAFIAGMIAMGIATENDNRPIGYVDHSGLLADPIPALGSDSGKALTITAFVSEEEALEALENGDIKAYFIISDDYLETRDTEIVYFEQPGNDARSYFDNFLKINLAANMPSDIRQRVIEGSHITIRTPDGRREMPDGAPTIGMMLPLVISMAFIGLILFSAGYMLEGIADEKLNRTIEVVFTSISPAQLISGKVLGVVGINFLQLASWVLVGIAVIFIAGNRMDIAWFRDLDIDFGTVFIIVGIGVPTYILAAAMMLAVGSTIVQAQEGQAVGGIFYMLMISPLILIAVIGENPNGPIAVTMSMLPFTSLLTVSIRNMFIELPWWEIAASTFIQTLLAAGAIWLAVNAFRTGMLRYGQRIKLRDIFGRKTTSGVQEE